MIKVKSEKSSVFVNIAFRPPLFEWHSVPARFFKMIYDALSSELAINTNDFSVNTSNSLGDVVVRYNVFNGACCINLSAEKLSMEFPNLLSGEYLLAGQIMQAVESSFPIQFSECQYSSIQYTSYEHATIVDGSSASDYLERYAIQSVERLSEETGGVIEIMGRFAITDSNEAWRALCTVEKSAVFESALFTHFDVTLTDVETSDAFKTKLDKLMHVTKKCTSGLDIEWEYAE